MNKQDKEEWAEMIIRVVWVCRDLNNWQDPKPFYYTSEATIAKMLSHSPGDDWEIHSVKINKDTVDDIWGDA